MKTARTVAYGAAGALIVATFFTGFVLDVIFIGMALGIAYGAFKFLK